MSSQDIVGVILAGGASSRFGGRDKAFTPFRGKALIEWSIAAIGPQVRTLAINTNGDPLEFEAFGCAIIRDQVATAPHERQGPLRGIEAALDWTARTHPGALCFTAPVDMPHLPHDIVTCLARALAASDAPAAFVTGPMGDQPLVALWRPEVLPRVAAFLKEGERSVRRALAALGATGVADARGAASYHNINTPSDADGFDDSPYPPCG